MPVFSRRSARLALIGVLASTTGGAAHALTVARCSALVDGTYVPVLIVDTGSERIVHHIGKDGLTRSILFNTRRARAWAAEVYGTTDVTASDRCLESADGDDMPAPPPPPPVDPGPEDPCGPPDTGGPEDPCGPPDTPGPTDA